MDDYNNVNRNCRKCPYHSNDSKRTICMYIDYTGVSRAFTEKTSVKDCQHYKDVVDKTQIELAQGRWATGGGR